MSLMRSEVVVMDEPIVYTPVEYKAVKEQPAWMAPDRVTKLMLLSLGLYSYVWFYRHWKLFGDLWQPRARPLFKTFLLIIPILDIFLIIDFVKRIQARMREVGLSQLGPPGWLLGIGMFTSYLLYWPGLNQTVVFACSILYLLGVGALLMRFQQVFNTYWEQTLPDSSKQPPVWTLGERVVVVLGLFFWCFSVLGLLGSWFAAKPA